MAAEVEVEKFIRLVPRLDSVRTVAILSLFYSANLIGDLHGFEMGQSCVV